MFETYMDPYGLDNPYKPIRMGPYKLWIGLTEEVKNGKIGIFKICWV